MLRVLLDVRGVAETCTAVAIVAGREGACVCSCAVWRERVCVQAWLVLLMDDDVIGALLVDDQFDRY